MYLIIRPSFSDSSNGVFLIHLRGNTCQSFYLMILKLLVKYQ